MKLDRARPFINWIAGILLLLWTLFVWMVGALLFSIFHNLIDKENFSGILVTWFFSPLMPYPWFCIIPYSLIVILVLNNFKLSGRQQ